MIITQAELAAKDNRYAALLINSLSGFKSANLVGTVNQHGQSNLSIVSSVVHLGARPPLLAMIIRPHSVPRDTLDNILATGYYTLNQVHSGMYQAAHQTSARYPSDVSEFAEVGLEEQWLAGFPAPFVAQSRIKLGMVLKEHHTLAINQTEMVIGEIQQIILPDHCVAADGYVDIEQAGMVVVSSLDSYHQTQLLAHLSYAKVDEPLQTLPRTETKSILHRQGGDCPKSVLVVGASGGIGQAFCEQLSQQCPDIRLYRTARSPDALPALAIPTVDIALDITDDQSITQAIAEISEAASLDWVFIATGWLHDQHTRPEKSYRQLSREHLQQAVNVNAISPSLVLQALLKRLDKRHPIKIAVLSARVGSISDNRLGGWHAYRSSKAALNMLIKNFAIEFKHTRRPYTIVGLQPGTTDTALSQPFQQGIPAEQLQTPDYTATQLIKVIRAIDKGDSGALVDFLGVKFEP